MNIKWLVIGVLVLATGCAPNSGIVPTGDATCMASRKGAAGFTDVGTLPCQSRSISGTPLLKSWARDQRGQYRQYETTIHLG